MASFEEILKEQKCIVYTTRGDSMYPLLKEGRDVVVISDHVDEIGLFDVVLTRRPSGRLLLHRVVEVSDDGSLTICGDNSYKKDYGIRRSEVIGKLDYIIRNEKKNNLNTFFYKFWVFLWCRFFFIRRPVLSIMKTMKK